MSRTLCFVFVIFAAVRAAAQSNAPDFGPNVIVLDPHGDRTAQQARIGTVFAKQAHSEFGAGRYAFLLMPGTYDLNFPVGFYTQIVGLGVTPDAVQVHGDLRCAAAGRNNNATTTFWRGAENFTVMPTVVGTTEWAVSQATYLRRMHLHGNLVMHQDHGWASGGWLSDSVVDGTVDSGSQQQWISRNTEWQSWTGSNWNMVFVGAKHAPAGEYPKPPFTRVEATPIVREKPYLIWQGGAYSVVVPGLQRNTSGPTWKAQAAGARTIPLRKFYIAHAGTDTAATMNAALAKGKHLLLTPGTYDLDAPLAITHRDTVVYGLGFATLHATNGSPAITIADVDGVDVSGILIDAGAVESPALLEVGKAHSGKSRDKNDPVVLHDVFFRVGGAGPGKTVQNLVIHRDGTIVDHTWIWRADHGKDVGWSENTSATGLQVDADDVTVYGLFVEHHQKFQVEWLGERGRTYFYQSEIPYDVPTQDVWNSSPANHGWASYEVGPNVKQHEAWGMGVYSVFKKPNVVLSHAFEVPDTPEVRLHHMITVALQTLGEISHIVNNTGEPTVTLPKRIDRTLNEYPVP